MRFQPTLRHLRTLTILAAVTVALPAAAEEKEPEPQPKSRDAKAAEPTAPAATVDLKIEGIRNGLQIRVQRKDEVPATDSGKGTSCKEDCRLKLPAGSYTLIATQMEPEETPEVDEDAPPNLAISESEAGRHRLGSALGVGGIIAAVMGGYLAIGGLVATHGAPSASASGLNEFFFAGVAGIAVGSGLMIGGFSMAATNRATPTTVDGTPAAVQRRDLSGTGVSLSGTF